MKKAFVIGHPISHSRSPLIHGYWLKKLGIEGSYEAIEVPPHALGDFIAELRNTDFRGGNVTLPHKEAVMALCDEVDPLARRIGAVNTLIRRGDQLRGSNSDYIGFLANLDAKAPGWDHGLDQAIVLGAGGAARAIIVALLSRGVKTLHLLNRTPERAKALADEFGSAILAGDIGGFADCAGGAGLVVNTSAVGMNGTKFEGLALDILPRHCVVTDIVYTPLETPLLIAAQALGLQTVDGLGMLLHQAVPGFEAWFGIKPEVTEELRAIVLGL